VIKNKTFTTSSPKPQIDQFTNYLYTQKYANTQVFAQRELNTRLKFNVDHRQQLFLDSDLFLYPKHAISSLQVYKYFPEFCCFEHAVQI